VHDVNKAAKFVYRFGHEMTEGAAALRNLLGGKGANLAEMSNLSLPVPPGFTITTEVCAEFYANDCRYPSSLKSEVEDALSDIGSRVGAAFGDKAKPLLLSVRSGARVSMPGMMDTVLNLGLNDETVEAVAQSTGDRRFAFDSYRRFIQMYSQVVLGIEPHHFEDMLDEYKEHKGVSLDTEILADDWLALVARFKSLVVEHCGKPFPQEVDEQLWGAIGAVFLSWRSTRAITYRRLHHIPEEWGTAVNVQAMVFGNRGDTSATGVAFTRNPSTGAKEIYGEFLLNAQGEDVVAGIRTPQSLSEKARRDMGASAPSLESLMPDTFRELCGVFDRLERHYRDMQDVEFTIQEGKLWMLQTRSGKRTASAALKIAADMANEGLVTREEAIARIDPASVRDVIGTGLPASPGAASGAIVFDPDEAEKLKTQGRQVILVRVETSPEDIHGMHAAEGILTTRGGMTSHAAVVARGMGKPCVSGAGGIRVDYATATLHARGRILRAGDIITIDGTSGEVMAGAVPTVKPELSGDFAAIMKWADSIRRMKVRANAETPQDARVARDFGAEGIGLCRTEHMFFDADRIVAVREMILAETGDGRRQALAKILPMQRGDFVELFEIMSGQPVTIRLLDPPLHEFLPASDDEIDEVADSIGADPEALRARVAELHEFNPMLGHRGVRLAISYPEIAEMQARAIFEAAVIAGKKTGASPIVEIMVPLVATRAELDLVRQRIDKIAAEVAHETDSEIPYFVGTMIELPRAALCAADIAETAEFFSFGTNDLTQTTFGISRDDSARFIGEYTARGIFKIDPFISLDVEGVGELVRIAAERGRAKRPELKLGICGEHGGDPASIAFCESVQLDYVSCSPFRVPIARLAAAQAVISSRKPPR
jgi:pyruvate,orthophosphate dikinase